MANSSLILNVDHNSVRRQASSHLLSSAGLLVHESASGQEALHRVPEINPDVVVLAGSLPDICGWDLCHKLRASPEFTSLILLCDSARADAASQNGNGGPDAWLPQRYAAQPFLSTVHTLLRLREAQMELAAANLRSQTVNHLVQHNYEEFEGFAFQACHDLEEPVRALSALVHLIERVPGRLSPEENMFLEQSRAGTERLRRLFGSLLSYSQVPKDHNLAPRTVDLNLAAHTAIASLSTAVRDSADIQVAEPLPLVSGHFTRLQQVFECLLANAIQYRRPEQQVVIRIGTHEDGPTQAVISVADNGAGIARQYHQVIFQPFKRLHGRKNPGSGMGLAICKRIIECHHGRIWVESEPGLGATFFFSVSKALLGD